jgi:hypothetical protein
MCTNLFPSAFIEGADSRVELFNGWSHFRGLISSNVTCSGSDISILAPSVLQNSSRWQEGSSRKQSLVVEEVV